MVLKGVRLIRCSESSFLTGQNFVTKMILTIYHILNPLHIYCRLIDRGFSRNASQRISRCYEATAFQCLTAALSLFPPSPSGKEVSNRGNDDTLCKAEEKDGR